MSENWHQFLEFEIKKNNQTRQQMKIKCVWNEKWKNKQKIMEKIKEIEFKGGIKEDDGIKIRV